jgi:hypothetical protein
VAKVRVPRRAWIYIEGTQAWADRNKSTISPEDAATAALWQRVHDAPERKDGSSMIEMTDEERAIFLDYATAWILGARDNAGPDDMDALADLRSLQSLINHLSA